MNLKDFLNYRTECPICQSQLVITFHSQKRQAIKYEGTKLVIVFYMDAITKNTNSYQVGYYIDTITNDFYIDFFARRNNEKLDLSVPVSVLNRFKDMNENLSSYCIYKNCKNCRNYHYSSDYFLINLKTCNIGDLSISKEYFGLIQLIGMDDGYKAYKLVNYYNNNTSLLVYGKINSEQYSQYYKEGIAAIDMQNSIKTGIINFSNTKDIVDRLNKLLIFI